MVLIFTATLFFVENFKTQINYIRNTNRAAHITLPVSPSLPVNSNPLEINYMRAKDYPGSKIIIEQSLSPGSNYYRYLSSYQSGGLKIYALLTIPKGKIPSGGWPVILFNHGYIPPSAYLTSSSYAVMINPLSAAGYMVFAPDFRGNDNSGGIPAQPYVSAGYITDSMNAIASIKQYKNANPNKIGVVGHSMGGNVTLHDLVISKDIKVASILSGVVGDEKDLINWWNYRYNSRLIVGNDLDTYYKLQQMIKSHGNPTSNQNYWNSIDPTKFTQNINVPVQIQVGSADEVVPISFSANLRDQLESQGKIVNFQEFPGADHNLSPYIDQAMNNVVLFLINI